MKKIIALVLALVMILSMSTVAFAKTTTWQEWIAELAASTVSTVTYQPAQAMASMIKTNAAGVADEVDAALGGVYDAVHQVKTAVDNTVKMAKDLAKVANETYEFASKLFKLFGIDTSEAGEFIKASVAQLNDGVKLLTEANKYISELDKWTARIGNRTYAGKFIVDNANKIANDILSIGNGDFVYDYVLSFLGVNRSNVSVKTG